MIHDLDVILAAVKSDVAQIDAVGVPVLTERIDIANVRLKFASGCIANLTASRISRDRVRKVRFFQPDSYLSIDYAAQEVEAWRLVRLPGRPQIEGGKLDVDRGEPLAPGTRGLCLGGETARQPAGDGRGRAPRAGARRGYRPRDGTSVSMSATLNDIERKLADHEPLGEADIDTLFDVESLLTVSALADELRRRKTGDVVTFVRVSEVAVDAIDAPAIPATAGENPCRGDASRFRSGVPCRCGRSVACRKPSCNRLFTGRPGGADWW